LLFIMAIEHEKYSIKLLILSFLISLISVLIKADIIILYITYLAFFIFFKGFKSISGLALISVVTVALVLNVFLFSKVFLPLEISHFDYAQNWNNSFPNDVRLLISKENIRLTVLAFGPAVVLLSGLGFIVAMSNSKSPNYKYLAITLFVAVFPSILFWGLKAGNSARHMSFVSIQLIFLAGFFIEWLHEKIKTHHLVFTLVLFLLIGSYFSSSTSSSTVITSTQLFRSAEEFRSWALMINHEPSPLSSVKGGDVAILDNWTIPYSLINIFKKTKKISEVRKFESYDYIELVLNDGRMMKFYIHKVSDIEIAYDLSSHYRSIGVTVYSNQFNLARN
jgi:hypothetical protein